MALITTKTAPLPCCDKLKKLFEDPVNAGFFYALIFELQIKAYI
jgi:hypothetical protein